jgi:hypothetical protein
METIWRTGHSNNRQEEAQEAQEAQDAVGDDEATVTRAEQRRSKRDDLLGDGGRVCPLSIPALSLFSPRSLFWICALS